MTLEVTPEQAEKINVATELGKLSLTLRSISGAGIAMTVDDFRRIALSMEGAVESSHMGAADFRVGGRIFATLASAK